VVDAFEQNEPAAIVDDRGGPVPIITLSLGLHRSYHLAGELSPNFGDGLKDQAAT
jgi:hypothetical protein